MRILTFSTLYPNDASPLHGVFVENRLRKLVETGRVDARVVAPIPWFPSSARRFGRYAEFARASCREERFGMPIEHPRYLVLPKVGMSFAPWTLFAAAKRRITRMLRSGWDFDLIDAHYFYPDGVSAVLLGRHFNRPVTVTARGSDLTLLARHAVPRAMIRWAAHQADGLMTVSGGLRDELARLDVDAARVTVLRNGVDLDLFRPADRAAARARLGVHRPCLASVGHLISRKGHDLAIEALASLPEFMLLVVGEGPDRDMLERLATRTGVADRVRFLGTVAHEELGTVYSAADALVLASSREGWANVLLESMACGTPVIASNIPGTCEVVAEPAAGRLMKARTAQAIVEAARDMLSAPPDRSATRAYAERFSWDATTNGQMAIFQDICRRRGAQGRSPL
jgi:glycosyltransferase involved in cell wall biosynthesis